MPSVRLRVVPYSGWLRTLRLTPESGFPSRVSTRPRRTAARPASIAPGTTSVWTGSGPMYRNSVAGASAVAALWLTGGATLIGSGGRIVAVSVVLAARPTA